jgi:ferritin-like metal-binding protein YciE
MAIDSLQDLFVTKLQMMYDAERQGLDAMPRMAQQLSNQEARQAFEKHRTQTEQHVRRLEEVFQQVGQSPQRKECISMLGLIQEAEQQIGKITDDSTRDAFVIAAQQAVEHKEMADYGTARTWARQLGQSQCADLLQQTLQEEEQTDRLLSDIAERMVNVQAAQGARATSDREVSRGATAGDRASTGAGGAGGTGGASTRRDQPGGETRNRGA